MESPMVMKIDAKVLRKALPASTFRPNGKVAKISLFINISYFIPDKIFIPELSFQLIDGSISLCI